MERENLINEFKKIASEIENDKLIKKYMYKYTWLSGSNTNVYPLTIWIESKQLIIQLNTNKNLFNKLIERYKNKYKNIDYGYFWKSDGSCPSTLTFKLK